MKIDYSLDSKGIEKEKNKDGVRMRDVKTDQDVEKQKKREKKSEDKVNCREK